MSSLKKVLFVSSFALTLFCLCCLPSSSPLSFEETINSDCPFHSQWETARLNEQESQEVKRALSQPFRYLNGGGQCMTFASLDDEYVIKFFKQRKFAIPTWIEQFPLPFLIEPLRKKKERKREERREEVFSAFIDSFNHLSKETSLLYVHLNPTNHLQVKLEISDKDGKEYRLELDKLQFVVQRKAELASRVIDRLVGSGQIEEAKRAIDQLIALQLTISEKGFRNRDPNFRHNYGFIGTEAILIDTGKIVPRDEKSDLDRPIITSHLERYLKEHHPQLLLYFETKRDAL